MKDRSFTYFATTAGADVTVVAGACKFGGFFLNGSAGGSTLNIYDGVNLIVSTSAGANVLIPLFLPTPLSFRTNLLATCSGTGFYSVLFST